MFTNSNSHEARPCWVAALTIAVTCEQSAVGAPALPRRRRGGRRCGGHVAKVASLPVNNRQQRPAAAGEPGDGSGVCLIVRSARRGSSLRKLLSLWINGLIAESARAGRAPAARTHRAAGAGRRGRRRRGAWRALSPLARAAVTTLMKLIARRVRRTGGGGARAPTPVLECARGPSRAETAPFVFVRGGRTAGGDATLTFLMGECGCGARAHSPLLLSSAFGRGRGRPAPRPGPSGLPRRAAESRKYILSELETEHAEVTPAPARSVVRTRTRAGLAVST
ncbi:hypothetical protein EVAR_77783_1 [Eumeta japonica]|uniref:Uncharacterized protein n=1 Tax=Eumeta variegata TaxID=151549 RepID=A0A4C1TDL0_EUMVA|nr:hypothetical protein EVAR_77783_1 [Eumeta japonica]